MSKQVHWSDHDKRWGPFTYARERGAGRSFGIILTSGRGDGDVWGNGCYLRMHLLGHTLIVGLPQIIQPAREWREVTTEPTRSQMIASGRAPGYWEVWARDFGFCFVDGALHYDYGRQTHSSETDKSGIWFLPWRLFRMVRHSFYDLEGKLFAHLPRMPSYRDCPHRWDVERLIKGACPTATFEFDDFDGERIKAVTKIEEREWRRGEGKFKWLSLFSRPKVSRSLDIDFSKETGRRKGSWKGGTVGHGIKMLPGELHEAAFRRYCGEHDMTFVGPVPEPASGWLAPSPPSEK